MQLSAPSNECGAFGGQQQGVKRPHDYSEQQQGRDYYGEYYQQGNQQYGSANANPYGQPRQQETSYGNVSGVSGTAYDRVEPALASTNESFTREGLTDVAKAELERPERVNCPDAYASVPAGQQQTIETYTRQSEPQPRYDFDAANKRGRY